MTADESGARGAQDARRLGELTHQSAHDRAVAQLDQMWPIALGEMVTARLFANGVGAIVYALRDVAESVRELSDDLRDRR